MPNAEIQTSAGPILAIIPARSGSKGIPGKNLRLLAGKPLLAYTVETALRARVFDRVLLTTDSPEIADAGRAFGVEAPFIRPAELARDDSPMLPVLRHTLQFVMDHGWTPEIVVLLQPTSPFRRVQDLIQGLTLFRASPGIDSLVSVEPIPAHYSPYYAMRVADNRLIPFLPDGTRVTRRQDAPEAYTRNGQFYMLRRSTLMEKNSVYGDECLPYVTRHKAVNLDTQDDWEEAEALAAKLALQGHSSK